MLSRIKKFKILNLQGIAGNTDRHASPLDISSFIDVKKMRVLNTSVSLKVPFMGI
jgi:hypothetical protein